MVARGEERALSVVISIIGALLLIVSAGAWFLYQEILIVWVAVLFNLVKGVTIKTLFGWLAFLMRRWLLIEVPKYMIKVLLHVGAPVRWRAAIRLYARRLRMRIADVRQRVLAYFTARVGKHVALWIAVIASVAVFVVGILYFGIYILYFFGGGPIVTALLTYLTTKAQDIVFRLVMFFQLDRLWRFCLHRLPDSWQARLVGGATETRRRIIAGRRALVMRSQGAFMTRRKPRAPRPADESVAEPRSPETN